MNYTTLEINGQVTGLKFGMHSARYLSQKLDNGYCFDGDSITEIGIAHVVYAGYLNNCAVKDIKATLTFEEVVDFVETSVNDVSKVNALTNVINLWTSVQFTPKETKETKKKRNSGKSKS